MIQRGLDSDDLRAEQFLNFYLPHLKEKIWTTVISRICSKSHPAEISESTFSKSRCSSVLCLFVDSIKAFAKAVTDLPNRKLSGQGNIKKIQSILFEKSWLCEESQTLPRSHPKAWQGIFQSGLAAWA
jgi:hypothetical protein